MSTTEFETLYKDYWLIVFRSARAVSKDPDVAKDVTQNVFLSVWKNQIDVSLIADIRKYLATAGWYGATQLIKKSNRRKFINVDSIKNKKYNLQEVSITDRLEKFSLIDRLDKAVDELSVPHRKVFVLSRLVGLSPKEVAKQLDLKLRTVLNYLVLADNLVRARF